MVPCFLSPGPLTIKPQTGPLVFCTFGILCPSSSAWMEEFNQSIVNAINAPPVKRLDPYLISQQFLLLV